MTLSRQCQWPLPKINAAATAKMCLGVWSRMGAVGSRMGRGSKLSGQSSEISARRVMLFLDLPYIYNTLDIVFFIIEKY